MDKYQLAIRRRIGNRVKQARTLRRLSQEELAELAHTGDKHVGQVERAEANVGIDVVSAIAKALSMDVSELVAPPPDGRREPAFVFIASEDLDQAQHLLRTLDRVRRASRRRKPKTSK